MSSRRAPLTAHVAQRAAIDRALSAATDGGLHGKDLRVLLALMGLVCSFDRVEDTVATRQVSTAAGMDARDVRRSMARLHELGVIRREPGRSANQAALISFDPQGILALGPVDEPVDVGTTRGAGARASTRATRGARAPDPKIYSEGSRASTVSERYAAVDNDRKQRAAAEPKLSRDELEAAAESGLGQARLALGAAADRHLYAVQ